jgi:hypothetical protein
MSAPADWIPFVNITDEEIPAGAVLEPAGGFDSIGRMRVRKCTRDNSLLVFFNSPHPVEAASPGENSDANKPGGACRPPWPATAAAVHPDDISTYALDQAAGTEADGWYLRTGNTGFQWIGDLVDGIAFAVPTAEGSGGGGGGAAILTGNTTGTPSGSTSSGISTATLNANVPSGLQFVGSGPTRQAVGIAATTTQQGMVTTGDQTWMGAKTVRNSVAVESNPSLGTHPAYARIKTTDTASSQNTAELDTRSGDDAGASGTIAFSRTGLSSWSTSSSGKDATSTVTAMALRRHSTGPEVSDSSDAGLYVGVKSVPNGTAYPYSSLVMKSSRSGVGINWATITSHTRSVTSTGDPLSGLTSYIFCCSHVIADQSQTVDRGNSTTTGSLTSFGVTRIVDGSYRILLGIDDTASLSGASLRVPVVRGGIVTGWGTISLSSIVSGGGGITSIDSGTTTSLTGYVKGNGTVLSAVTSIPWADISDKPATLTAFAGLTTPGVAVLTAADTWATRTIAGTADRITITNGDGVAGNPTIDISTTYVGQASLTTLGTIATGTWEADTIEAEFGGTGHTVYVVGDVLFADTTTTLAKAPSTAFGRGLWNVVEAAAARTAIGAGVGDALKADPLSQFAPTTSAELAGVISDETGTGPLVFATSPTLVTPALGAATATTINGNTITTGTGTLTLSTFTLTLTGAASVSGTNTGDQDLSSYATIAAVAAGYQPLDSDLTAIAALSTTGFGRAFLTLADAAAAKAYIGAIDLSGAEATGVLAAARFPALTGDVTTTAGNVGTTIVANAINTSKIADNAVTTAKITDKNVTLAKIQDVASLCILGRPTTGSGVASEIAFGGARRFVASDGAGTAISARPIESADLPTLITATTGEISLTSGVSVTSSWANVSGLSLTLPGPGKYKIVVTIAGTVAFDAGFYGTLRFRIRNATLGSLIGPASLFIVSGPNQFLYYQGSGTITTAVTVAGGHTIDIQGLRSGSSGINFLQSTFDEGSTFFYQRLSE